HRGGALACADLRLAAARVGLGEARGVSLGIPAADCDPDLREDRIRHFVLQCPPERSLPRLAEGGFRASEAGPRLPAAHRVTRSRGTSADSGLVARSGSRRPVDCRRGASAPLSRTNLIRMKARIGGTNMSTEASTRFKA